MVVSPSTGLEAGDLLAVEAVDPSGTIIRSDGAIVHILAAAPPNAVVLSAEDRARFSDGFLELIGRLAARQSLQFYVQARPIDTDQVLARARREVEFWAGRSGGAETLDRRARDRWRLYAAMEESIRLHAHASAAVSFETYVVVPFIPDIAVRPPDLLGWIRPRPAGRHELLRREAGEHRRLLRKARGHVDGFARVLESLGIASRPLDGEEVVELLFSRFNPTSADLGSPIFAADILADLSQPCAPDEARARARRLRERIAGSAIDFACDSRHALVERDAEQVIYAATTAEATSLGWLMGAMVGCALPFTLSVHVHALDRRHERRQLKRRYHQTFAVNRAGEAKGRVPDFERYAVEEEQRQLLSEMSSREHAKIYRVSIYQSIRTPGPRLELEALAEAIGHAVEQIETVSDCRVDRGRFQQRELWTSTLPLALDHGRRTRRYAGRNAADTVPLLGVSVGSPSGIPFAYSEPGRTLEYFNPYDRVHPNHLCLITGRSGAGKTLMCNVLLARSLAFGARGFVIDRAGHYRVLTDLIDGAQHLDIGSDDSRFHLNPWDVDDPSHVSREKVAFLIGLHHTMITEGLSTLERAQLGAAIRAVYERAAAEGAAPREGLLVEELRRRAAMEAAAGAGEMAVALRNLAERLGEFCGDGAYAHLADQPTTALPDSPLLVFDTRRCPEAVLRPVIFTILEFVVRSAERHRDEHAALAATPGAPLFAGRSVMLGDEFWSVVSNPALGAYANDLARRSRHLGMTMVISTQQLSDLDTEYGLALLRNSTIQVFLAQHRDELQFVQRALGLSDAETELIGRLKTVKGAYSQAFWVNGTRGRGQVSLRIGPTEMWAFTSDPVRDAPIREQRIADNGGNVWLAIQELAREVSPERHLAAARDRAAIGDARIVEA